MSVDLGESYGTCDSCGLLAFDAPACATCAALGDHHMRYCSECRGTCRECGETYCVDHLDRETGRCEGCLAERGGPS